RKAQTKLTLFCIWKARSHGPALGDADRQDARRGCGRYSARSSVRLRAALRLASAGAALTQRGVEIALRIAERDAAFAIRRAVISLALDTLVDHDQIAA